MNNYQEGYKDGYDEAHKKYGWDLECWKEEKYFDGDDWSWRVMEFIYVDGEGKLHRIKVVK